MKTSLLFITLCFLSCLMAGAQAPAIEWQKCLGGSNHDYSYSIQQTTDNGYIVAGVSLSNNGDVSGNHGARDFWIVKLNSTADLQWQKSLGGTNHEIAYSIQQTTDGGYIAAGYTISNDGDVSGNHGSVDYWVVKLSNTGDLQWQKCLGGTDDEYAYSIQQTTDGGYIVAGYTSSNDGDVTGNHGSLDVWIVKLTGTGDLQWQKCLGGTDGEDARSIQETTDGGYIVAGYTNSTDGDVSGHHGYTDCWIVKLNASGEIQWQKCLGGTVWDLAYAIQQCTDGGYIVAAYSGSTDGDVSCIPGHQGYWVVKLNSAGELEWQNCFGGTWGADARSIQQTTDGGYIVAGDTYSNDGDVSGNHGALDSWVVKLNNMGELQWQKCLGGTIDEYAFSIQQTTEGGYVVAGLTSSNDGDVSGNHGETDFWVVKLEEEGLAIHLVDISARNEGRRNYIQWETAREDDGDSFVLERSADGIIFNPLASIHAKGSPGNYSYHDEHPLHGINYYRLQLNNIDGQTNYSKMVTTRMSNNNIVVSAYPNPAKDNVTIAIQGPVVKGNEVHLTDMTGKTIRVLILNGSNTDIGLQGLAKGMYLLQFNNGFYSQVIKLEVE